MQLRALVLGIPFAFLVAACTYDNGDAHQALYDNSSGSYYSCGTPTQATIDTDQQLDIDAGQGAGVFIEYATGGHYHVRVACDTALTGLSCSWQVTVTPPAGKAITNLTGEGLEGNDSVASLPPNSVQLNALTTTELDGFTFDTDPGTAVSVEADLDGTCATPYFFWFGNGALHQGSPSDPITLTPSPE
jgi:hypothetical protein